MRLLVAVSLHGLSMWLIPQSLHVSPSFSPACGGSNQYSQCSPLSIDPTRWILYRKHSLFQRRLLQLGNGLLRAHFSHRSLTGHLIDVERRYGASFCTTVADGGPCTSNCNAQAQCGPNAPAGEEECPLKVCCSQFGYCGTTEDFCGTGCLSNCNPAQTASCGADQQSALGRRIGYYEGWASSRSCDAWTPSTMNVDSLTHVNFAFASISSSFEVIEMTPGDSVLWAETTALKSRNPSLKIFLSIGGWSFNDPPTSGIFSALAASSSNTQTFINSVLITMLAYGFDGIGIDWEYPVAEDRGGSPGDMANYPIFLSTQITIYRFLATDFVSAAIKTAFGPFGYQLSFTAPSSYWYLQNHDLPAMLADGAADWVNVMTYNLHGARTEARTCYLPQW
ncbi:glycoside hydrolase superfamily [Mycena maculata]|uniref:Glycoside hydrolase superfamily n=1 Tax=Mycena maculata TaxID=230809 RepID=A0AAD7NH91_9AGAR|nr:glycoside hydrolase superfamily [Mycena maculata]